MNRLKRILVLVVVLCFIPATNVYADKMKHRITTIDDVKEFRTLVIKRMNTKLESDNTNKKQLFSGALQCGLFFCLLLSNSLRLIDYFS